MQENIHFYVQQCCHLYEEVVINNVVLCVCSGVTCSQSCIPCPSITASLEAKNRSQKKQKQNNAHISKTHILHA